MVEEILHIIIPNNPFPILNTFLAACVGEYWLPGKLRSWKHKLTASTLPFLLIFFPMFYLSFYTEKFSGENFYRRILIYWLGYLCIAWAIVLTDYLFRKLEFPRLKRSAVKNLGWIAGNASGIDSWQSRVGENSKYYRMLMNADNEDARLNADLYYTWKKQGENEPYNEKKCKKLYKKAGRKIKKADSYMKGSYSKNLTQHVD